MLVAATAAAVAAAAAVVAEPLPPGTVHAAPAPQGLLMLEAGAGALLLLWFSLARSV